MIKIDHIKVIEEAIRKKKEFKLKQLQDKVDAIKKIKGQIK